MSSLKSTYLELGLVDVRLHGLVLELVLEVPLGLLQLVEDSHDVRVDVNEDFLVLVFAEVKVVRNREVVGFFGGNVSGVREVPELFGSLLTRRLSSGGGEGFGYTLYLKSSSFCTV